MQGGFQQLFQRVLNNFLLAQVYDGFLKGETSVDVFVQQYVKARILFHQRELKMQAAQQTL